VVDINDANRGEVMRQTENPSHAISGNQHTAIARVDEWGMVLCCTHRGHDVGMGSSCCMIGHEAMDDHCLPIADSRHSLLFLCRMCISTSDLSCNSSPMVLLVDVSCRGSELSFRLGMSGKSELKQAIITQWAKKTTEQRVPKPTAASRRAAAASQANSNENDSSHMETDGEEQKDQIVHEPSANVGNDGGNKEQKQPQDEGVDEDGDAVMVDTTDQNHLFALAPAPAEPTSPTANLPPKKRQKRGSAKTKATQPIVVIEPIRHSSRAASKLATERLHTVLADEEPGSEASDYSDDDAEAREEKKAAARRAVLEASKAHDRLFFFKSSKKRAREAGEEENHGDERTEGDGADEDEKMPELEDGEEIHDGDDVDGHMMDPATLLPPYKSLPKGQRSRVPSEPPPSISREEQRKHRELDREGLLCLTEGTPPAKIASSDLESYPLTIDPTLKYTTTASILFMLDAAVDLGNWENEAAVLGTALSMRGPCLDIVSATFEHKQDSFKCRFSLI
jgi:hypothetical protein